jgi:hypothetical protein
MLKFIQLRIIWPVLVFLAAFVIFFEFIAEVGGSGAPQHSPPFEVIPPPVPTPSLTPEFPEPQP